MLKWEIEDDPISYKGGTCPEDCIVGKQGNSRSCTQSIHLKIDKYYVITNSSIIILGD